MHCTVHPRVYSGEEKNEGLVQLVSLVDTMMPEQADAGWMLRYVIDREHGCPEGWVRVRYCDLAVPTWKQEHNMSSQETRRRPGACAYAGAAGYR